MRIALAASLAALATASAFACGATSPGDASAWRPLDPQNTLYLQLPQGRVVIALAPGFAPRHVANVKALARAGFYDGLAIVRLQDNYVVQWGDADAKKPMGEGARFLPPEFDRPIAGAEPFVALPDADTYAPQTGFSGGFPVARDPASGRTWLTHCYGMVGAGRDNGADTGGGPELYAVIGQAPRQLDRNVTLLGRVVEGMDLLSGLPRGHGAQGFYETAAERTPILSVRLAADVPSDQRTPLEEMRTDSPAFAELVRKRRFPAGPWFKSAAGRTDVCNLAAPVRRVR
ncbi:MAG TPA: peptidylprolyl isomerase [Caulobacteraceae bacterium]|nr:peptidylprolyl isomerase [Caulobacteraceae bacterium]